VLTGCTLVNEDINECISKLFIYLSLGWCYGSIMGTNSKIRMILKESLRSVPIFGWCMQLMMYIFLTRKREDDIPHIQSAVNYLINSSSNPAIFIFPEGTDLSESNIIKSNKCKFKHIFISHFE
jgi:1-acyl-sn-glycerol-3-phosphate acyltransferase